jgi:hypothetical protein
MPTLPLSAHARLDWLDANVPWIAIGTAEIGEAARATEPLEEVLRAAILRGIRVIDTAPNYHGGLAESCVGRVIASTQGATGNVYVLTKAGQLTDREMRERANRGLAPPGQHWCFDGEFLEMSIARSIRRLGQEHLDCVLLHNPEDAIGPGQRADQVLAGAVATIERMCREQKVRGWGIASWTGFYRPPGSAGSIQLGEFCRFLGREYGKHHFVTIELPMGLWNLHEFYARRQVGWKGMPRDMSVPEAASALGITLLLNSPFCGAIAIPRSSSRDRWLTAAQRALLKTRACAPHSLRIVGMRSYRSLQDTTALLEHTDHAFQEL